MSICTVPPKGCPYPFNVHCTWCSVDQRIACLRARVEKAIHQSRFTPGPIFMSDVKKGETVNVKVESICQSTIEEPSDVSAPSKHERIGTVYLDEDTDEYVMPPDFAGDEELRWKA